MSEDHGWTGKGKPRLQTYEGFEDATACFRSTWGKFRLLDKEENWRFKDRYGIGMPRST